jgi:hypothetical protein
MTHREQLIFNGLLKESDNLRKVNPEEVVIIQISDDIMIWWKDSKDNFRMKLVRVTVLPSAQEFVSNIIKDYRELVIEQIIE